MHEMSYVMQVASMAERAAGKNNADSVSAVSIAVGEMTGLVPEYLTRYWPYAVKRTILEGSELVIDFRPVRMQCACCGKIYHPNRENHYLCPDCKTSKGTLLSGREFELKSITVVEHSKES